MSFGPGQDGGEDSTSSSSKAAGGEDTSGGLLRSATQKSSLKRSLNAPSSLENLALRAGRDEDRPNYSKDYLSELRNSTPTTPQTLSAETSDNEVSIGEIVSIPETTSQVARPADLGGAAVIPTDAEIREKKERRARLAKEQEYISLDDGNDGNQISLLPRKAAPATRNVRDDEDFAEGFDEYVEDGRVALGKKAEAAQRKKARAEMKGMIDAAEESSDEDDSEAERNRAYDEAQTRAGMDGLARRDADSSRARAPTIITPIPRLPAVIERLRGLLREKEAKKTMLSKQMEALQKEKAEIAIREVEIQNLITETGTKYEQLQIEAGLSQEAAAQANGGPMNGRGLENIGNG